jgi:hypothetical protein
VEAVYGKALGARDFGCTTNNTWTPVCGPTASTRLTPAGVRPVTVGGHPGVTVIYTTGKFAQYRLVPFPATIDANHPGKLFDKVVGAK